MYQSKKVNRRVFLSTLLVSCMLWSGCAQTSPEQVSSQESSSAAQAGQEEVIAAYKTCTVELGTCQKQENFSATLVYPKKEWVFYQGQAAKLEKWLVVPGQAVEEGEILAQFSVGVRDSQMEEAELALEQAQRREELAETERQQALQEQREKAAGGDPIETASLEKLEAQVQLQRKQAEAQLQELEKTVEDLEEQKANFVLRAPFAGVVESLSDVKKNQTVNPGQEMVLLYSQSPYYLQAVDVTKKLRVGMEVEITAGSAGNPQTCKGIVVSAPSSLPAGCAENTAYIQVEDGGIPENTLKQGASISFFSQIAEGVPVVPEGAIYTENDRKYVRILEGNAVHKRYVTLGMEISSGNVWITQGVEVGQTLILR